MIHCEEGGPFPATAPIPIRPGLFAYLNGGKRSAPLADARDLIADADVLIDGHGLTDYHGGEVPQPDSRLVVVRISNFGQYGPLRDRVATPLTMQAIAGWISARDPDRPPVQAGARIAEYVAGAYAALGALTALRVAPLAGQVTEVDVSVLEALLSTLPYPMLMFERLCALGTAHQRAPGADAGRGPRRRRLGRDQLPDRTALARRLRHARSARVWRAAVRDHDGWPGARRVLRGRPSPG